MLHSKSSFRAKMRDPTMSHNAPLEKFSTGSPKAEHASQKVGNARAAKLSPYRRLAIARKAARAFPALARASIIHRRAGHAA
jgi:hypothetical protein